MTPWTETYSGKRFNPDAPEVFISDIAHGLSNLCRFSGQSLEFYSVAEHSVLVAQAVSNKAYALEALLHDAAEAYIGDVPRPIKARLPCYQELEERIMEAIVVKYGLTWPLPPSVVRADLQVLARERRALMRGEAGDWGLDVQPAAVTIRCYRPKDAKIRFMETFYRLAKERGLETLS